MQVFPGLEGNVSPYGAFRVVAPTAFQDVSSKTNATHFQELYHNLPQLQQNDFVLPMAYRSIVPMQQKSHVAFSYGDQQQQQSQPFYNNRQSTGNGHKHNYGKHHSEMETNQQNFNKRQGSGYGYDAPPSHSPHGGGHGWGKDGNSPALSALALLGFMFFLQLIQNSLQNNRAMLAAAALNSTTFGIVAGRDNKYGYNHDRHKRSIPDETMLPVPTHEYESYTTPDKRDKYKVQNSNPLTNQIESTVKYNTTRTTLHKSKVRTKNTKKLSTQVDKNDPWEILRSSSLHCCQLIACKLGQTIFDSLDKTTGFMVRMVSSTVIPNIPKKTWTGRLLRAVDNGWKKESCDDLYRNCAVLYKWFNKATKSPQSRRKRKYVNYRYKMM